MSYLKKEFIKKTKVEKQVKHLFETKYMWKDIRAGSERVVLLGWLKLLI